MFVLKRTTVQPLSADKNVVHSFNYKPNIFTPPECFSSVVLKAVMNLMLTAKHHENMPIQF